MRAVTVRNMTLGEGIPKIAVPVTEKTVEAAVRAAEEAADCADLIELRADHFEGVADESALLGLLASVRRAVELPILFTVRSMREGGAWDCTEEEYASVLTAAIGSGQIDLVDIELACGRTASILDKAHKAGIPAVLSQHDFGKTPADECILRDFMAMEELGGDVAKGAYMPQSQEDADRILTLTRKAADRMDILVILIAMGPLGRRTRVEGERWGSALTFASLSGKGSAPGQIDARTMRTLLLKEHAGLAEEQPK